MSHTVLHPRRKGFLSAGRMVLFAAAGYCASVGVRAASPGPTASAQAVHAAFVINLTRFVSWPESAFRNPGDPLVIGTFPRDPINVELDAAVRGEEVLGHPVQTIRLASLADVLRCHVVYFSRGTVDPELVLKQVQQRPTLTVSDVDKFLELGGHVALLSRPPYTRLQVSAANLRTCGLEARAQLLRIATNP